MIATGFRAHRKGLRVAAGTPFSTSRWQGSSDGHGGTARVTGGRDRGPGKGDRSCAAWLPEMLSSIIVIDCQESD